MVFFAMLPSRPISTRRIHQEQYAIVVGIEEIWRSAQSGANLSPSKFPGNREFYREFAIYCPRNLHSFISKLHILRGRFAFLLKSEQGINRDVSGKQSPFLAHEQGIHLPTSVIRPTEPVLFVLDMPSG